MVSIARSLITSSSLEKSENDSLPGNYEAYQIRRFEALSAVHSLFEVTSPTGC